MAVKKLNSMRLLEQHGIPYELVTYDNSIHDALELAEAVGVPGFMVYKTLVVDTGEKKPLLALVAADSSLDLKKLAKASGYKKLAMARHTDAENWTKLQTGGISPLMLMDKGWRIYLDQPATQLQQIMVSAGQRGMNLRVPTVDLMRVLMPIVAEISAAPDAE
jgi:Cys-tRNA(Pro)/Cys-tRNA(Cys) deacylase